jgi:hypothetical protein
MPFPCGRSALIAGVHSRSGKNRVVSLAPWCGCVLPQRAQRQCRPGGSAYGLVACVLPKLSDCAGFTFQGGWRLWGWDPRGMPNAGCVRYGAGCGVERISGQLPANRT